MKKMKLFILLIFVSIINFFNSLNAQELRLNEIHNLNSKVFFMRHALAPGNGDPENFKLDDCSTQRNLSNDGIYQARKISNEFKKYDIKFTKVYSSYWCRCYETVKSMGLKKYELHSGLNSFYQNYANKKEVLKNLKDLISSLDKKQGPYLFVTHYVVIGSYTDIFPVSGGIVVHDLNSQVNNELQLF